MAVNGLSATSSVLLDVPWQHSCWEAPTSAPQPWQTPIWLSGESQVSSLLASDE